MRKLRYAWIIFLAVALFASTAAAWSTEDLDALDQAFSSQMSSDYVVIHYPWQFITSCTAANCFGSNPDSPYGSPNFGTRVPQTRQLRPTSALVLIMETPPPVRYFGVTPYIFARTYTESIPYNPFTPGIIPVFESLTDTVNLQTIGTIGSPNPGTNAFSQLSVIAITADVKTYNDIAERFVALGFPAYAINQISLPINAVPLHMGISLTGDTYTVLLRMAYPDNPDQMTDYINRTPVKLMYLVPTVQRAVSALPTPISRTPGDGQSEPLELAAARNQLVDQLTAQFATDFTITESTYNPMQTINYVCVRYGIQCKGDNPDAIYTRDVHDYIPSSVQDRILIVGVNHVKTNKATYLSHSIVNPANDSGVKGVSDTWLDGSGLGMANVTDPNDPRYTAYQQLYAFTVSYDCGNDPWCVTIPQPTPANSEGIVFGDPFELTGRIYLDPATGTRPAVDELIFHKVFILTKK